MTYVKKLYGPLLTMLLFASACVEIPDEHKNELVNGYYGCARDMTVVDAASTDIATLHPDMYVPTCKYDWIPQSRAEYVYTPWTSYPSQTRALGASYVLFPDPDFSPGLPYTYMRLRAWPDPYNPAFTRCSGCDTIPHFAATPRLKFSIDIKAVNMPNIKAGDVDVWIQITRLVGTSQTWWSPQTMPSERKLMPGHYDFDLAVPFHLAGTEIRVVVQNFDVMDGGLGGGYIQASITSKSMKTTQPCAGWLPDALYPITTSIP